MLKLQETTKDGKVTVTFQVEKLVEEKYEYDPKEITVRKEKIEKRIEKYNKEVAVLQMELDKINMILNG